jgi:hypothetical protein
VQAQSLLQQARAGAACLDLADELDRHLARLDSVATAVTRRLQELDGALDQSQC